MEGDVLIRNVHTGSQDLQYMSPCVFLLNQLSMVEALHWMIYNSHTKLVVICIIIYGFAFIIRFVITV